MNLLTQMQQATTFRGHKMAWNAELSSSTSTKQVDVYVCEDCGRMAIINSNPAPNEIDLGGAALALGCSDTE